MKSRFNSEYFGKKDDTHRFCILEITHTQNVVRQMSQNFRLRRPFEEQHGKRAQTLLKLESLDLYRIY